MGLFSLVRCLFFSGMWKKVFLFLFRLVFDLEKSLSQKLVIACRTELIV